MTTTSYYSPPLSQIAGGAAPAEYAVFKMGGSYWAQASAGTGLNTYIATAPDSVINSAITALNGVGGGTIAIRAGTYTLTSPIILDGVNNISIVGENWAAVTIVNSTVSFTGPTGAVNDWSLFVIGLTAATTNITLKGLTVKLNAKGSGITLTTAHWNACVDVNFNLNQTYTIDKIRILQCYASVLTDGSTSGAKTGLSLYGGATTTPIATKGNAAVNIEVRDSFIIGDGGAQTEYGLQYGQTVVSVSTTYFYNWGQRASSNGNAIIDFGVAGDNFLFVVDCFIDTCGTGDKRGSGNGAGINMLDGIVSSTVIVNCGAGILVGATTYFVASDCVIKWNQSDGINAGGTNCVVLITNCTISNNNQAALGTGNGAAIRAVGANKAFSIVACYLTDDQATATQNYGLVFTGAGPQNVVMSSCSLQGNLKAAVGLAAGADFTGFASRDNYGWNPQATSAITVTASPFTYTNKDGYAENIAVVGGTVSEVDYVRGTSIINTGATAGLFSELYPGDAIKVTYSFAPTMSKVPQ